ncbi:MAG: fused MFS/spermidine synthase [Nannocystales bacterium]
MGSSKRWRLLFLLFFASGVSGLIYESIWSRYIKQLVGSAAEAQILVLSLFMGGMSLGALLSGRLLARVRVPIVAYGVIEGLIGLYALAFPYLFAFTSRVAYDTVFPALGGGSSVLLAKWVIAALLIVPPCLLLGMTFPLMSVGILRREKRRSGEVLAVLYFSNSLGAAFGALLSGFALVPWLGLPGALMVGAAVNLVIMVVAVRDREVAEPIAENSEPGGNGGHMVLLYLAVAFGTGLSSFLYEVGWIRLLSMVLGSATHSFEVMLSAFVFGLALGGFWVRKRMDKFKRPELTLAIVQIIMGVCAVATLPAYEVAVEAMAWLLSPAERTVSLWYQFNVLRYLLCLLIMLPATFCAGMTLPLLTHLMLGRGQSEAVVGRVYGVNTLGAITGATLGGLVLMPLLRLQGLIVIGALADMLLGIALIRGEIRQGRANALTPKLLRTATIGAVLVTVSGLLIKLDPMVLTSTVFRKSRTSLPDSFEVLSYVDGRTATVAVVENIHYPGYRIIYTNGKPDASVILNRWPQDRDPLDGPDIAGDEPNQFLVGLVPLMVRPDAKNAALIGFGSGVTCHTVLGSPTLERLDTVEIEPEMVEGSKFFRAVNWRAYDDERSHIHFDDAKAFFASSGIKYDFIVSEPTNPWVSGVSSLFTVEFYQETKRYLAEDGVLAQWLQGYELSDDLLISVLAALDQEFEDYLIVRIGSRDWVILSSPKGRIGPLSNEPLSWPGAHESFSLLGIHDIAQIDGLIVANRQLLHPFLRDRQPNRDSHPILDTGAERERFLRSSAEFLHKLRFSPAPLTETLASVERRPYPLSGIGDLRKPHILYESEQAVLLMRRYVDPGAPVPATMSAAAMDHWQSMTRFIDSDPEPWSRWMYATYEIYAQVASHLPIHETPFWQHVRTLMLRDDVPPQVRDAVALLTDLSRRDGESLLPLVQRSLESEGFPLPLELRTIAGVVALEETSASPAERQAFVDRWMMDVATGNSSEDLAYQVVRAYAARE